MKLLTETRKTIIELRRRNYHINDNANGDADKPPLLDLFSVLSGHIIGIQPWVTGPSLISVLAI